MNDELMRVEGAWCGALSTDCRHKEAQVLTIPGGQCLKHVSSSLSSETRKLNKTLPDLWKKWPKILKHLYQSLI
jgi:hypothetical protein